MIDALLRANSPKTFTPHLVTLVRLPAMPIEDAKLVSDELLADHGVRMSPLTIRYLGDELIEWLDENAGSWRVIKVDKCEDNKAKLSIVIENEESQFLLKMRF